ATVTDTATSSRRRRSESEPAGSATAWLRVGGEGALGAEVRVDGRGRGHAPTTLQLPVGAHTVELVRRDGARTRHDVRLDVHDGPSSPHRLVVP
ncbi:MAG: PEGA domain-containing protein, partial [Myxococcales bacterium]|nr:PEGA domain-containing protein [Myxococcales bacterium]